VKDYVCANIVIIEDFCTAITIVVQSLEKNGRRNTIFKTHPNIKVFHNEN